MRQLTKTQKADATIRNQLEKELKECPYCQSYESLGGNKCYKCEKIPDKQDGNLLLVVVSSYNPCRYEDIISCPLLGNGG